MSPDAVIINGATWTAGIATVHLVVTTCVRVAAGRTRLRGALALGAVVALAGGGVALAAPGHGRSPHVSADWPVAVRPMHPRRVVVEPGDCLWDIAARRLHRPTSERVAMSWPVWWRRNRGVIGADPDLIRPGQRLRPPVLRSPS